jgi:hypothetical protein
MNRRRARVAVLGAWLLAGAIGCQTATGDESRRDAGARVVGLPPWTIGGAKLGMSPDEAERALGPPTTSETKYGRTTTTWKEISVTFDQAGRAVEVFGDRLTSPHGATLLTRGASEADVVAQIGPGTVRGAYAPSGSGVINCSYRRTGGTHAYEDAATRYEVSIYEDRLASVRLLPRQK